MNKKKNLTTKETFVLAVKNHKKGMNLGWTEKTTNEKTFRDRGSGFGVVQYWDC